MTIAVLAGAFPTSESPSGGIFITRRLIELKKMGVQSLVIVPRRYQSLPRWVVANTANFLRHGRNTKKRNHADTEGIITSFDVRYEYLPVSLGLFTIDRDRRPVKFLYRYLKGKDFDVLHAHGAYPEGYWAAKLSVMLGKPFVVTAHGSDICINSRSSDLARVRMVNALHCAERVLFVSSNLLGSAKELGYDGKNAVIIPNGYDPTLFYPRDIVLNGNNSTEREKKTIGFVGNLVKVKGADRLPSLFRAISGKVSDVKFLVVGEGPLRSEIGSAIGGLDVQFTGAVTQNLVPSYMQEMDVLIVPSRSEGWGCVIKEAQAMGIPSVGSAVGGIPEAIGPAGVLVADGPHFIEDFSDAVAGILEKRPDKANIVTAARGYTWSHLVAEEYKIYADIVGDAKDSIARK